MNYAKVYGKLLFKNMKYTFSFRIVHALVFVTTLYNFIGTKKEVYMKYI